MKIAKAAVLVLALAPAAVVSSVTSDAHACGMSVRLEPMRPKPTPVQEIAAAEKSLEAGQDLVAARAVLRAFPSIRTATAGRTPLETRAIRVFSLAVVRSDGAITERRAGVWTRQEWAPRSNLAWAVQALRAIDQKRPNDPAVQADLGEALSKLPETQGEALAILSRLADKDLMGSPNAYAALARLKSEKGDSAGAEAAVKRCEEMSKTPGTCKSAKPAAKA